MQPRITRPTMAAAIVLAAAITTTAQVRQVRGGNALDANPMVGSGGVNFAAPPPPINRAQALMTGNVTGGAGFRGYSAIRDPSQLFVGLPSSNLSDFRSRSTSVADVLSGAKNYSPYGPGLYYDPSSTVTNVGGILRGLNRPGSSTPASPYVAPRANLQPSYRDPVTYQPFGGAQPTGAGLAVEPALQRTLLRGPDVSGPYDPFDRTSSDSPYAVRQQLPLSQVTPRLSQTGVPPGYRGGVVPRGAGAPLEVGQGSAAPLPRPPLERVLDTTLAGDDRRFDGSIPGTIDGGIGAGGAPPTVDQSTRSILDRPIPGTLRPSWLGQDRFRDMAIAVRTIGTGAGALDPKALAERSAWAREYLATPVRSFVGTASTNVNEYFRKAEDALREGNYYRAAGFYEMAGIVDPDSPLPILGRSQALIAAGEYMTATLLLDRAVEKFPEVAYFKIDLNAFITDPRVIERRRADLEQILERVDDYRFRFVLGYMEYHSGLTTRGLENLAAAAVKAPPGSTIARYPALLKAGLRIPPVATQPTSKP